MPCRVISYAHLPGGGRRCYGNLCDRHRGRQRRHGDPLQQPIRASHLAPFIRSLDRRQKLRPDAAAWSALMVRWDALLKACHDTLAIWDTGTPMRGFNVEAARELVKVAEQASPERAWKTAVAMCLLREADPHLFASETSFRVQLGRRVRHLTETNRGRYWNPAEGRYKFAYRDPSPRATFVIGDMLNEVFGVAGLYFAKQDRAEAAAKVSERKAFHDALREVAPEGTASWAS